MGLCAFDDPHRPSIQRGIDTSSARKMPTAHGPNTKPPAPFPKFLLKYDMYRIAGLLAMATFRNLVERRPMQRQLKSETPAVAPQLSPILGSTFDAPAVHVHRKLGRSAMSKLPTPLAPIFLPYIFLPDSPHFPILRVDGTVQRHH